MQCRFGVRHVEARVARLCAAIDISKELAG
jgi:hypothetical protein